MDALFEKIFTEAVERFGDVEVAKRVTIGIFMEAYDETRAAAGL